MLNNQTRQLLYIEQIPYHYQKGFINQADMILLNQLFYLFFLKCKKIRRGDGKMMTIDDLFVNNFDTILVPRS